MALPDLAPAGGAIPTPTFVGMGLLGVPMAGELWDFTDDVGDVEAYIAFEFMDASFATLCFVLYDADDLVSVSPASWSTDSGGRVYGAWEVVPGGGWTDCGPADRGTFGTTDLRVWLAGAGTWGVGVGEITAAVEDPLRDAVVAGGGDWAADWAPYVFGTYVARDDSALEMGYAFSYPQECGVLLDPSPMPAPLSSIDERVVSTGSYWVFNIDALL